MTLSQSQIQALRSSHSPQARLGRGEYRGRLTISWEPETNPSCSLGKSGAYCIFDIGGNYIGATKDWAVVQELIKIESSDPDAVAELIAGRPRNPLWADARNNPQPTKAVELPVTLDDLLGDLNL